MNKNVSIEKLINKFEDMANRGTLLTGAKVNQNDLLMQIIGTIIKTALEETTENSERSITVYRKEEDVEVTIDDFMDVAKKNGLMEFDLEGLALTDDMTLILCDECGKFACIPEENKYIIYIKNGDSVIRMEY